MDGAQHTVLTADQALDLLNQLWPEVREGDPERLAQLTCERGGCPRALQAVLCELFADYIRGYLMESFGLVGDEIVQRFAELLANGWEARWIFDFLLRVSRGEKQLGDEPAGAE